MSAPGDGAGTGGGSTVQETLNQIYGGWNRNVLSSRYTVVGLALVAACWYVFGVPSAIALAAWVLMLARGFDNAVTTVASRRWPTTEGVVVESTVLTLRELRDSFEGIYRSFGSTGGYVPLVRYEYTVDGERHVNVRISPFDGRIGSRRRAESVVENYPRDEHVTVRYDPADPSRSFLQLRTRATWFYPWLVVSVGLLGAAVVLAVGPSAVPWPNVDVPSFVLLLAAVGFVVVYGLYLVVTGLRTYRWPTTTGIVRGNTIRSTSSSGRGSKSYLPKLRYEYEVDGDTYVSSRVAIAVGEYPQFNSRSKAQNWLEDYPIDGEVTVHYNPRRPEKSVLEPRGVLSGLLVLLVAGGAATLIIVSSTRYSLPVDVPLHLVPL